MQMSEILKQHSEPDKNGCMNWIRAKDRDGYGQVYYNGRDSKAHRVIWEYHYGSIPKGLLVCHKCDNPSCVNPEHLFVGSQLDNIRDKIKKGRQRRGEELPNTVLTESQVITMRQEYISGVPMRELCKKYPAGYSAISNIVRGRTWKHIPNAAKTAQRPVVSDGMVRQIRTMSRLGLSFKEIANELGMNKNTVYCIAAGLRRASVSD